MKSEILRNNVRIFRPTEWEKFIAGIPKVEYRTMMRALLYTGMRYIEMKRLQKNPQWFDGEFIHLPKEAVLKKRRKQLERYVRLNQPGRIVIEYFLALDKSLPSYQSWSENMKCWARRANMSDVGLSVKTSRKTLESWLMFYYPTQVYSIVLSQGHTDVTSLRHYLNMPFTETDRLEMRKFIEGWI